MNPLHDRPPRDVRAPEGLPAGVRELIAAQRAGWGLDRAFYTDPAIFALEMERVVAPGWLFVAHESRIPRPGDYITYQVGDEPLILIRGHDGRVRALFNLCRHRGSKICREPCGTVKKLVCPYHQWVYETDGRLISARLMPDEFDAGEFGLLPARVHVYEGLVFLSLADEPLPFPAPEKPWLAPYDLGHAKVAHVAAYDVRANWKIVVENFLECYHCTTVHPEYSRAMAGVGSSFLSREEAAREAGRDHEATRAEVARLGLDPDAPRLPFRHGVCTQSLDGRPVAPLMGRHRDYDGTMLGLWITDTLEMEANPDHVVAFRFTPLAADRTDVEVSWLVRGDAVEGTDYDRERLIPFWKITGEQDWSICEAVQAGVTARHYRPGPLSRAEHGSRAFLQRYLARLADGE